MTVPFEGGLAAALADRGITRRRFLAYCGGLTATLALPAGYATRIADALEDTPRLAVVWLNGQDCAGNTEALLRGSRPTVSEVIWRRHWCTPVADLRRPVEVLRTLHSFDPCMACAVHVHDPLAGTGVEVSVV